MRDFVFVACRLLAEFGFSVNEMTTYLTYAYMQYLMYVV